MRGQQPDLRPTPRASHQEGSLLIGALVVLLLFSAAGTAVMTLGSTRSATAADHYQGNQALYVAEAGLEWAAREFLNGYEDDVEAACDQIDGTTRNVSGGVFVIAAAYDEDPTEGDEWCLVTAVGHVPDADAPASQRRLRTRLDTQFVNNSSGGPDPEDNVFGDESNWNNMCGPHVHCDGGTVTFSKNNNQDSLQSSGNSGDLAADDAFGSSDEVYLVLAVGAGELTDFGMNRVPPSQGPPNNWTWSNVDHRADSLFEDLGTGVVAIRLGDGYTPEELNGQSQLEFEIEWNGDSITVDYACVGSQAWLEANCSGGGSNKPGDNWQEE